MKKQRCQECGKRVDERLIELGYVEDPEHPGFTTGETTNYACPPCRRRQGCLNTD